MGEMHINLFDHGMTTIHKVGLAGIYMTLKKLDELRDRHPNFKEFAIPEGCSYEYTDTSVTFRWSDKPQPLFEWLIKHAFMVDNDGLIRFIAHGHPEIDKTEKLEKLIQYHNALLGTFLQFPKWRKATGESNRVIRIEDKEVTIKIKQVERYIHQYEIINLIIDQKSQEIQTSFTSFAGWLIPGGGQRHFPYKETRIEESADRILSLAFAPIAVYYFEIKSNMKLRQTRHAIVIPNLSSLEDYSERFSKSVQKISYKDTIACSSYDALFNVILSMELHSLSMQNAFRESQVITFGNLNWVSITQKPRTSSFHFSADVTSALQLYEIINLYLPSIHIRTSKEGLTYTDSSVAKEHILENMVKNRPWFADFSILMSKSEFHNKLYLDKSNKFSDGGLTKMVNENELWKDFEIHELIVKATQTAIKRRYAQLAGRVNQEGGDVNTVLNREYERIRVAFAHCKNAESIRREITDFWSRAGQNKILKENWNKIIELLYSDDWTVVRDLALLALASYGRADEENLEEDINQEGDEDE